MTKKEKTTEKKDKKNKFSIKLKSFKKEKEITTYTFKEVLGVMLVSIIIGFILCYSFNLVFYNAKNYLKLTGKLSKFVEAYNTITNNYYGDIDTDTLLDAAIAGMFDAVDDPNTSYSDSEETKSFLEKVEGIYEGIGCEIVTLTNGDIMVYNVFEGTPAYKAGLKAGDIITHVDGKDCTEKDSNYLSSYIKESKSKEVILNIIRDDEKLEITINRAKIEIPTVSSKVFENNNKKIGYIKIDIFSSVTDKQFINALENLEKEKISGLIIDVRDNAGGYLDIVTSMLSTILKKDQVIYKLEDKSGIKDIKAKDKEYRTYPIAVLTNKSSASASEILAAAIKESYGGYVVGTSTYGKGTVQKTDELSDGSMIKYTTQRWLTPKGNWINGTGLEPTHIVELSLDYFTNPSDETDNQLQEAIKLLTN